MSENRHEKSFCSANGKNCISWRKILNSKEIKNIFARLFEKVMKKFEEILIKSFENVQEIL